jgi:hypothetical protein
MARANEEVAGMLREHAELISVTGGDSFRARNYSRAASPPAGSAGDVAAEDAATLRKIPRAGRPIADEIIARPLTRRTGRRPMPAWGAVRCLRGDRDGAGGQHLPGPAGPPGEHIRTARDAGVTLTINTDAHSIAHLGVMPYGAGDASAAGAPPRT